MWLHVWCANFLIFNEIDFEKISFWKMIFEEWLEIEVNGHVYSFPRNRGLDFHELLSFAKAESNAHLNQKLWVDELKLILNDISKNLSF